MANQRLIEIDVAQISALANDMERIDPARLGAATLDAVNRTATQLEQTARDNIVRGVNLSDPYVRQRLRVEPATNAARVEAFVAATTYKSSRNYVGTPLGRYDPKQLVTAAANPKRAKGDRSRGIAPGMKQAGVSVEVLRGARKVVSSGNSFTMPLKNGNGLGVFTRSAGQVKYKHRLGPSVYQLFRTQAGLLIDDVAEDLSNAVAEEAQKIMREIL